MRRVLPPILFLLCALFVSGASERPAPAKAATVLLPQGFWGIGPQTELSERDLEYMVAGGVERIRWPLPWNGIQPTEDGGYHWAGFDNVVANASRHGLQVLPFIYGTPSWVAKDYTRLPIDTAKDRKAWTDFLRAAVARYGPHGDFWRERAPGNVVGDLTPVEEPLPIRQWQLWNEANFFYFAYPVSPQRYARLLQISSPAIKSVHPGAKVILTGLFGEPSQRGARGMAASKFLAALYRYPGIRHRFDGIALHPYAIGAKQLEKMVEEMHQVTVDNRHNVPLYITEMGWGSENNYQQVAFEQGIRGQVKQLRNSYAYLIANRARLRLRAVYWFSWKDLADTCSFCDSVGFFREGPGFRAKPSWRAFTDLTGGSVRP